MIANPDIRKPVFNRRRIKQLALECLLLITVIAGIGALIGVTLRNLEARGMPTGLEFLWLPARFAISEAVLEYRPSDSYYWAAIVGIANSIFITILVALFSSILGLIVGIGRLSHNALLAGLARVWVELARNTPPIVLLFFLYSLWWKLFPEVTAAFNPLPGVFISMRGIFLPDVGFSIGAGFFILVTCGIISSVFVIKQQPLRGRRLLNVAAALATFACFVILAAALFPLSVEVDMPVFNRANFRGGLELTPEFVTIVFGLTIYTTGFVAEIVRAGLLSVGRGQWEAGQALGLRRAQLLRYVVIPQMYRVILPPMTSQYINILKNSTLAIAVGYPDFFAIMGTIINKSSHAIEGVGIILGVYLSITLSMSLGLNVLNRRLAIPER